MTTERFPPISLEAIRKLREEEGLGLSQARRILERDYCNRVIAEAKTVEDLKPVLKWLVDHT